MEEDARNLELFGTVVDVHTYRDTARFQRIFAPSVTPERGFPWRNLAESVEFEATCSWNTPDSSYTYAGSCFAHTHSFTGG